MAETDDTRYPSPRDLKALIEAERTGLPFVHWRDGAGAQHILMLGSDRGQLKIGRRESCDIALTWDPEVSRLHALLEPVGDQWTLIDEGLSRNGSFVNRDRIHGRHRLNNRDQMCFGGTHVVFRSPNSERGSQSTARAAGAPSGILLTERKRKVLIELCRPIAEKTSPTPATNPVIAAKLYITVDTVKAVLRELFDQFGLSKLPQNEKRTALVAIALDSGLLKPHDF
ncbi:MAG TPA: FHA domain-containing protein [Solirubrobacteraceae bacterium]|nr:FHA domain-containing protein [Solirubrobacteraceae bacterium]